MSVVELRNATYAYGDARRPAVAGATLAVAAGSLVGIAGPNGSGKSTLLKMMARVIEPQSGEIVFQGVDARRWKRKEYAQRVGYLPQESDPVFPMRALDVVLSGRAPFLGRFDWESDADLERARRALAECDAAGFEERFLDEMSGGERKRVELARVLAGEPELILLDEPLAALDLSHAQQLAGLLRAVARGSGRTVLFVSHELNWSAALAERTLVMHDGRIVADGPPAEVFTEPLLREHFGLDARVVEVEGRRWVVPR
ncbi:MAG TPA: ABC transporter ATP-binding protein [Thermoanaerobaculia bacterium]